MSIDSHHVKIIKIFKEIFDAGAKDIPEAKFARVAIGLAGFAAFISIIIGGDANLQKFFVVLTCIIAIAVLWLIASKMSDAVGGPVKWLLKIASWTAFFLAVAFMLPAAALYFIDSLRLWDPIVNFLNLKNAQVFIDNEKAKAEKDMGDIYNQSARPDKVVSGEKPFPPEPQDLKVSTTLIKDKAEYNFEIQYGSGKNFGQEEVKRFVFPCGTTKKDVVSPIVNLFRAWETRDANLYIQQFSPSAAQHIGSKFRRMEATNEKRRQDFSNYSSVKVSYNPVVEDILPGAARVSNVYTLEISKTNGGKIHEINKKEDYVVVCDFKVKKWLIFENNDYLKEEN